MIFNLGSLVLKIWFEMPVFNGRDMFSHSDVLLTVTKSCCRSNILIKARALVKLVAIFSSVF